MYWLIHNISGANLSITHQWPPFHPLPAPVAPPPGLLVNPCRLKRLSLSCTHLCDARRRHCRPIIPHHSLAVAQPLLLLLLEGHTSGFGRCWIPWGQEARNAQSGQLLEDGAAVIVSWVGESSCAVFASDGRPSMYTCTTYKHTTNLRLGPAESAMHAVLFID